MHEKKPFPVTCIRIAKLAFAKMWFPKWLSCTYEVFSWGSIYIKMYILLILVCICLFWIPLVNTCDYRCGHWVSMKFVAGAGSRCGSPHENTTSSADKWQQDIIKGMLYYWVKCFVLYFCFQTENIMRENEVK